MAWRCQRRVDGEGRDVGVGQHVHHARRSRRAGRRPWRRGRSAGRAWPSSDRNSPADHGRGYTCSSMRTTLRRWRRRIGASTTSNRPSGSRRSIIGAPHRRVGPVDLGVGLAQVQRRRAPTAPRTARAAPGRGRAARATPPTGGRGPGRRARPASGPRRPRGSGGRRRRRAGSRRGRSSSSEARSSGEPIWWSDTRCTPPGHLPVEGVEHLAPLGVDGGDDEPRRVAHAGRRAGRGDGTPIIGTRSAWAMALAAAMPTRRPVNRPGPRSTATQLISSSSTRAERRTKSIGRREQLGVAPAAGGLRRGEHALVAADGAPTWCVADSMPRISTAARPRAGPRRAAPWRAPGPAPTTTGRPGASSSVRSSSPSPRVMRTSR